MIQAQPRVVVTGMGVVAPNGGSLPAFWRSVLEAKTGIAPIDTFDASEMTTRIAGQIKGFDIANYIDEPVKTKRFARQTLLAMSSIRMAIDHSGLSHEELTRDGPLPIYMGVGTSSLDLLEHGITTLYDKGPRRVTPYAVSSSPPHSAASALARYLDIDTRLTTLSTACASGCAAVSPAADLIRNGRADLLLVGATDAPVTPFGVAAFCSARMMSTRNDDPLRASRPFDSQRDGGLLAEASAFLVLENHQHAMARGATIYAEILGQSINSDNPDSLPASGLLETMREAISNSALVPDRISFINSHGTSDVIMDRVESLAIKKLFADKPGGMPVTSIKGVTGNPLAAGGALQMVAGSMAIQHQMIPQIANFESPDPDCDLDYVAGVSRSARVKYVLTNAHGFGGVNVSIVLGEFTS